MGVDKIPERNEPRKPQIKRTLGGMVRAAAAASLLFTVSPGKSADAAESDTRKTTVARLTEPERAVPNDPYMWIISNEGPGQFWLNVGLQLYPPDKLSDAVLLYATEKSPRGYWDALLDGKIPANRLKTDEFITTALGGESGVEYFLRLVAEQEQIKTVLKPDEQNRFTEIAAATDPVAAAHFMYRYYEEHEQKEQFSGNDLILKGIHTWREAQLGKEKSGAGDPNWHAQLVQVLNHAYVLPPDTRASIIKGLDPRTIYNVAVADADDIYTSSFKKLLAPRIEDAMRSAGSIGQFLNSVQSRPDQTSTFLELTGRFGEFARFLQHADERDITTLGSTIISTIEKAGAASKTPGAVSLVEFLVASHALSHIPESTQRGLESMVRASYDRATSAETQKAFGVVASVYGRAVGLKDHPELNMLQERYPVADFSNLSESALFTRGEDGMLRHIQRWFFADSSDGRATLGHALGEFEKEGGWDIARHDTEGYVVLTKRAGEREAIIYMNTPNPIGVAEGDKHIADLLRNTQIHTIAARGHSYEEENILARIRKAGLRNPSFFLYGSCGSNDGINAALDLSDTFGLPLLVTSKGEGKMKENHKILSGFIDRILISGTISFPEEWPKWRPSKDYVPPHENYAAMVIYDMRHQDDTRAAVTSQ